MKNKKWFGNMYLNMIISLVEFLFGAAVNITNSLLPFKNGAQIVKDNLAAIKDLRAQAQKVITGYAAQKRALRKTVTVLSYNTMKSVFAFALNTNNANLIAAMRITKKELNRMKMTDFTAFIQAAITTVSGYVNDLADYNVTPATILNWQTILNDLQKLVSAPNNAINARKKINEQIQILMNETVTYISTIMDSLSLNFSETQPGYLMEYRNNRRLKGSSKHTKLKVRITDELEKGIFNIPVLQNNTINKVYTDINGDATVYILLNEGAGAQPVYEFTIGTAPNSIQTGPVEIKKGHTVSKTYIIQPTGFIIPAPQETPQNQNA